MSNLSAADTATEQLRRRNRVLSILHTIAQPSIREVDSAGQGS